MTQFELHQGDCLEVMKTLPDNSVDSIVTDPPYGISFMGKKWDYDVPGVDVWAEALRLLKPGGHILVACGTRTQHRMVVNIEDAGFEIRDTVAWIYGSGFPKSLDVSKAIDKAAGAEREVVGMHANPAGNKAGGSALNMSAQGMPATATITAPASDDAKQWSGWGTALKPAMELWTLARKPLEGTVATNVLKHGTGSLNIDACRIEHSETCKLMKAQTDDNVMTGGGKYGQAGRRSDVLELKPNGRFPANVIHDGSDEVVSLFPQTTSGALKPYKENHANASSFQFDREKTYTSESNAGSAARFFYCAKASKSDRNGGLEGFEEKEVKGNGKGSLAVHGQTGKPNSPIYSSNHHPTVKPTALMQYLCRLITPPGGTVLDPYTGSGSTGKAAMFEDFRFIGIERELEYVEIATARIEAARTREPLFLEADSQKTQGGLF